MRIGFLLGMGVAMFAGTALAQNVSSSKLNEYGVLQATGPNMSKTNSYAVLQGAASASKLVAYSVLCTPPGVGVCPALPVSGGGVSQNGIDLGIPW